MADLTVSITTVATSGVAVSGFSTLGVVLEDFRPSLGGRSGASDAKLVRYINQVISEVANALPDDTLVAASSVSVVSGTAIYTIDSTTYQYKRMLDGTVKLTDSASDVSVPAYLPYHAWEAFKARDNGAANPVVYYSILPRNNLGLTRFELYDTPAAAYTLALQYVYWPERLAVGEDSNAIPLPPPTQTVFELGMEWKCLKERKGAQGDIQEARNVYESELLKISHGMQVDQLPKWGHVEAQYNSYQTDPMDHENLE